MKKLILFLCVLLLSASSWAFCGFYVAKADLQLFNKTSQVILVRNGEQTTVTMSSDFEGDVNDFAMVVPVPVVIGEKDIKVVERSMFDRIDAYSTPRLVSYNDRSPCSMPYHRYKKSRMAATSFSGGMVLESKSSVNTSNYQVTIEAKYTVGEYDILILSAEESGGLERWLNDNGYKIPKGAKEVLDPYIKSNMKFFVVKVNLKENEKRADKNLRPIQITYSSPKFMLPIRLGMANAKSAQDMIVYLFSNKGRVEVTNYRTVEMVTSKHIPSTLSDQSKFSRFYKDMYYKSWEREGKNVAFLEYAWNIGTQVPPSQKCDPCVSPPPVDDDLRMAGVDWVTDKSKSIAPDQVFFTRLHITYDRNHFPQDLLLNETPNKQNYQARYIITRPAWNTDCAWAQAYYAKLKTRRQEEVQNLVTLAGWKAADFHKYIHEFDDRMWIDAGGKKTKEGSFIGAADDENEDHSLVTMLTMLSLVCTLFALTRKAGKR